MITGELYPKPTKKDIQEIVDFFQLREDASVSSVPNNWRALVNAVSVCEDLFCDSYSEIIKPHQSICFNHVAPEQ